MTDITAIIVAKDNPKHMLKTIKSVEGLAEKVVVIDIGLDQKIVTQLQENKSIKIVNMHKEIPYVELIREESKEHATTNYVLILDPDEVVSPKLKKELLEQYKKFDYIEIPRKNIIFDKWIQHARWWPDYQVRLFKKEKVTWKKQLHAQPKTNGIGTKIEPTEELALVHYNYENISEYLEKMIRYAKSEAKEKANSEYKIGTAIQVGINEFISRFFAGEGYKEGMHGFSLAVLQLMYPLLVYFFIWEEQGYKKVDEKEVVEASKELFHKGLFETNYWASKNKSQNLYQKLKAKIVNIILE